MMSLLNFAFLGKKIPEVLSEIHSGLGNQMFQYAVGRSLADRTNSNFGITRKNVGMDAARRLFGLDAFQIRAEEVGYWTVSVMGNYSGWRGKLAQLGDYRKNESDKLRLVEPMPPRFIPELINRKPPVLLTGYWQSEDYFKDCSDQIRKDFTLAVKAPPTIGFLASKMRQEKSVSLHIRRGDYVSNPEIAAKLGVLKAGYYREAIQKVQSELGEVRFYIFSDEPTWVAREMAIPENSEIVHTADEAPAWHDLWLMSQCEHHILANSSYSWWGAWLGERRGSLILAPRKWSVSGEMDVSRVIPARWHLI